MAQNESMQAYQPLEPSRSLTLVSPRIESLRSGPTVRAETGFVAQLLAVRLDAPQYRVKRRETPASAVCAYRAVKCIVQAGQLNVAA